MHDKYVDTLIVFTSAQAYEKHISNMTDCPFKDEVAEMRKNLVPQIMTVRALNPEDLAVVKKVHPHITTLDNDEDLNENEKVHGFFG